MDALEQLCRNRGLKLTIQRRIVLEILQAATDHPCAHEIQRRTEKERRIGIATIYRALNALVSVGLVKRHIFGDGKARYERFGYDPHPHLIDIASGAIVEVDDSGLTLLLEAEARKLGYRLVEYRLKMFGVDP